MTSELICPAGFERKSGDQIEKTAPEAVGFLTETVRLARLQPNEMVLVCRECGCVWRNYFDAYLLRHRDVVLGRYSTVSGFEPAQWLKAELDNCGQPGV